MSSPVNVPKLASALPSSLPAIAVVGYANCGKTTLICKLLTLARQKGWRVAAVKHSHKKLELDQPGKDTWRFRQAGAQTVALACPGGLQVIQTFPADPPLAAVLASLPRDLDLVLVEGYKHSDLPKLVFAPEPAVEPLNAGGDILAYISANPLDADLPVFSRDQAEALFAFLERWRQR